VGARVALGLRQTWFPGWPCSPGLLVLSTHPESSSALVTRPRNSLTTAGGQLGKAGCETIRTGVWGYSQV
jgi:hypothetical protein